MPNQPARLKPPPAGKGYRETARDWWLRRQYPGEGKTDYPASFSEHRITREPAMVVPLGGPSGMHNRSDRPSEMVRQELRSGPRRDDETLKGLLGLADIWEPKPPGTILIDPPSAEDRDVWTHEAMHGIEAQGSRTDPFLIHKLWELAPPSVRKTVKGQLPWGSESIRGTEALAHAAEFPDELRMYLDKAKRLLPDAELRDKYSRLVERSRKPRTEQPVSPYRSRTSDYYNRELLNEFLQHEDYPEFSLKKK